MFNFILSLSTNSQGKIKRRQHCFKDDGSVVEEDNVVKALDKNTVLMVLKEEESWAPTSQASISQINMEEKKGSRNTEKTATTDGCMRLDNAGGQLKLTKPTEEV